MYGDIIFYIFGRWHTQKPIIFQASPLEDLRTFPLSAKRKAGHQLDWVQKGQEPDDWKPMHSVGQGIREIRIRDATGGLPNHVCGEIR